MTTETLNGDETGYAVGLPVWVTVTPDGVAAFVVDLDEADGPDDLTDEQAHLPALVRRAVQSGSFTVAAR